MNRRLVSLAAAIVLTAIQWTAFFSPVLATSATPPVGGPVVADVSASELPALAVAKDRWSFFKY
jgi:hypothetical protein